MPDRLNFLARRAAEGLRLGVSFVLLLLILVNLFGQANKRNSPAGENGIDPPEKHKFKAPSPCALKRPTEKTIFTAYFGYKAPES